MSGNENEMPDSEGSTRLRDRARSRLEQVRDLGEGAAGRSTRLADRARTAFERRRQQAQRAREAVDETSTEFADALDLDPGQIEPVQLDDRGEEIGFVPDESGRSELAMDFASERPFVEPTEAFVDADPREGVRTRVRPEATDDIAARARQDFAGDDPFAEPGDFAVDVGPGGVTDAGFTPEGEVRRASRQFEGETPLREVEPNEIERTGDGFSLTGQADDRLAARRFETQLDTFGTGELDPQSDIRETDDGFGLTQDPAREVAAERIDEQVPQFDIGPSDITLEETDSGRFEGRFEREVSR
jgi:hypothetical protein